jgi:hypothetical protein
MSLFRYGLAGLGRGYRKTLDGDWSWMILGMRTTRIRGDEQTLIYSTVAAKVVREIVKEITCMCNS